MVLSLVAAIACNSAVAQVISTFNTDLEGWMITGDNAFIWQPAGGNPDGNLDVNDLATGAHNYAAAPRKFLGDWSGFTSADRITCDVYVLNTSGGSRSTGTYVFRIAGPGGSAWAVDAVANYPPLGVWTTLSASFDESEWTIQSGTWHDILANVTSLRVNAEFVYGSEEVRMDNIGLSAAPLSVFVPCAQSDFNTSGLGDWSFQGTNGVSNPGSGGNAGGYARVADRAGTLSLGLAPSIFLGDWSSLDNNGLVTIDLRIISRSATHLGVSEFIRISGPGGSAYVTIDPDDFPMSSLVWKTYAFPIDSSVWTVDSGTWSGLLSNITQCLITLEFYDGTETIGFDNFGRLLSQCAPVDDTVQVHDTTVKDCGSQSMVAISSVAFNRYDGKTYGLIRNTPGSGGGLYQMTGPEVGIRIHAYDKPAHLIFDNSGHAFVSEDYSGRIYRLDQEGNSSVWISEFGGSGDDDPYGMTIAPSGFNGSTVNAGDILIADRGSGGPDLVWAISPDTPEGERLVMPDPGTVDHFDLTAGPNGVVYLCDALDADNLFTLAPDGTLTALPLNASVGAIYSIVYDGLKDDIYIAGNTDKAVYRVDPSTGNVTLVADGFGGFHPCCLEIHPANRRLWVADNGRNRIYEFCLDGGADVDVSVSLEGSDRPVPDGWQIPLSVKFFSPGSDVLRDTPVHQVGLSTAYSGGYAVCRAEDVAPGVYDITAVSDHTLTNVIRNVAVSLPSTSANLGTLREGNADNNGIIDTGDFGMLAWSWLAREGDLAYETRTDFDRSGNIGFPDLVLLAINWLESSPIEIP